MIPGVISHVYVCACERSEEEDREMAAAMRASMAVRRQEERAAVQERIAPKHRKEERTERTETDDSRHRTGPKPTAEPPGKKGRFPRCKLNLFIALSEKNLTVSISSQ